METPQQKQWRQDPDNWVWGMFYFNREDPRLLPPKQIPWMGWTVNFANWKSVGLLVVVLGILMFIGRFIK